MHQNRLITNTEHIKEILTNHYRILYNDNTSTPIPPDLLLHNALSQDPRESLINNIQLSEINTAITKTKSTSAGGEDGITNQLLKAGGEKLTICLQQLFNQCMQEGETPESWNNELMCLLHKRGSYTYLDNFRGISLTNVIGKIFTSILAQRVMKEDYDEPWLPEAQISNRKGRCAEEHTITLQGMIEQAKHKQKDLHIAFLDIAKAYDNVRRPLLWSILKYRGFLNKLISLLQSTYAGSCKKIRWKGHTTKNFKCNKGLKQGCALSGVLFNHYISPISAILNIKCKGVLFGGRRITHLAYADDLVLVAETEHDMQTALTTAQGKLDQLGLKLNFSKSKILTISNKERQKKDWQIHDAAGKIQGSVKETEEIKYLGISFATKGNTCHARRLKDSLIGRFCHISAMARQSMDKPMVMYHLWRSSVKPSVIAGLAALPVPQYILNSIDHLEIQVAREILGLSKTTCVEAIRGIMSWIPLSVEIEMKRIQLWWTWISGHNNSQMQKNIQYSRENNTTWYKTLIKSMENYDIQENIIRQNITTKKHLKQHIERKYWLEWEKSMTNKLTDFPYAEGAATIFNAEIPREIKEIVYQVRVGDRFSITGHGEQTECQLCNKNYEEWTTHVLMQCNGQGHIPTGINDTLLQQAGGLRSNDTTYIIKLGKAFQQWINIRKNMHKKQITELNAVNHEDADSESDTSS